MAKIISSIVSFFLFSPKKWFIRRIHAPLTHFVYDTVEIYKQRTRKGVNNVKDVFFRGAIITFIISLLVWLSVFMYVAFYYSYVPEVLHERPIYLTFRPCETTKGLCGYPSGYVLLTKRQQFLMSGQPYKIQVELEMPESPANKELGMFIVCADFHDNNHMAATSCRSAILKYRSPLVNIIYTFLAIPYMVFGNVEEKQFVYVDLFPDFQDNEEHPVKALFIEVRTRFIELYSAKLLIRANFSGIRYFMFQWPIFSAALGVTFNLFFIAVLCVTSWYQLINSQEYINYKMFKEKALESSSRSDLEKIDTDDSSSFEENYFLDEEKLNLEKQKGEMKTEEYVVTLPSKSKSS